MKEFEMSNEKPEGDIEEVEEGEVEKPEEGEEVEEE